MASHPTVLCSEADRAPARTPRAPFLLGITGKMDFPGYEDGVSKPESLAPAVREVYERVWAVLEWLRGDGGSLDSGSGRFCAGGDRRGRESGGDGAWMAWRAHGLKATPIVVLSSLAPGADTIVAEAALDYAEKHPGCGVSVRAPLPFPLEVYKRASSFVRAGDSERETCERVGRLERLVERIRGQEGFVEDRDLFEVRLDRRREPDQAEADLEAKDGTGWPRRRLRYRAAGEYVATHSQLLLAVYDEQREVSHGLADLYQCSTVDIVEAKRRGLTFGLLAISNSFSWADNGPVLRIPIDNDTDGSQPCRRPLALLHPFDTRPPVARDRRSLGRELGIALSLQRPGERRVFVDPGDLPADDQNWQLQGDRVFRSILRHQEAFNALAEHSKEPDELDACMGGTLTGPAADLPDAARAFAGPLDPLARVRRRAAASSSARDARRESLLARLAALLFLAAFFLGAFQYVGDSENPAGAAMASGGQGAPTVPAAPHLLPILSGAAGLVEAGLLFLAVLSLALAGWLFWQYRCTDSEEQRFDHRAIGEALRVQLYWILAGLPSSVAAEYMQRQRGELSWIRSVVDALTIPLERWRGTYANLDHASRLALLKVVRTCWVQDQRDYARKTARKNEGLLHLWQHWGWTLAAAGLLNVLGLLAAEASPRLLSFLLSRATVLAAAGIALGAATLAVHVATTRRRGVDPHDELYGTAPCPTGDAPLKTRLARYALWILRRPLAWGWATPLAAVAFWIASRLPISTDPTSLLPTSPQFWSILTGLLVLSGAMCLAWSERNFHAEHARQNLALLELYSCADRRLATLLERYEREWQEDSPTLIEIQAMLRALGREALEENAEWLILHRTRPLEPFLA